MNPILTAILVGLTLVAIPLVIIASTSPDIRRIVRVMSLKVLLGGSFVFALLGAVVWVAWAIL